MGSWLYLSSLLSGSAAAWVAVLALDLASRSEVGEEPFVRVEEERRRRLRDSSLLFARAEPIIRALAATNAAYAGRLGRWIGRTLTAAGMPDWSASEYLAVQQVRAVGLAMIAGLVAARIQDSWLMGLIVSLSTLGLAPACSLLALRNRANRRRAAIAARLPYAVDLMALMLESGGHLIDAIATLLRDMERHPLADELGQVHRSIRLGLPHDESFQAMGSRVGLPALNQLVAALIQGERGGTPLAEMFRIQADQLRIRRSQDIEKAAAKANVHMVYPSLVSMLACLLVMAAQFVIWLLASR
jgi:tight adherence protein C